MAGVTVATGLTITTSTADAQSSTPAALAPAAQVDVGSFASRAEAWTSARSAIRESAIARAEELAVEAKAAEEEAARLAAEDEAAAKEEAARLAAEEEAAADEAARLAATTTTVAPTTTAPPPPPPTVAAAPSGGPTAEQWAALRRCESGGNYSIVSANGRYRGAYQFSQATWDSVARSADPSLVGVDPAAAPPAAQDAMAYALYRMSGASPWPHCGVHLR